MFKPTSECLIDQFLDLVAQKVVFRKKEDIIIAYKETQMMSITFL